MKAIILFVFFGLFYVNGYTASIVNYEIDESLLDEEPTLEDLKNYYGCLISFSIDTKSSDSIQAQVLRELYDTNTIKVEALIDKTVGVKSINQNFKGAYQGTVYLIVRKYDSVTTSYERVEIKRFGTKSEPKGISVDFEMINNRNSAELSQVIDGCNHLKYKPVSNK